MTNVMFSRCLVPSQIPTLSRGLLRFGGRSSKQPLCRIGPEQYTLGFGINRRIECYRSSTGRYDQLKSLMMHEKCTPGNERTTSPRPHGCPLNKQLQLLGLVALHSSMQHRCMAMHSERSLTVGDLACCYVTVHSATWVAIASSVVAMLFFR